MSGPKHFMLLSLYFFISFNTLLIAGLYVMSFFDDIITRKLSQSNIIITHLFSAPSSNILQRFHFAIVYQTCQ